MQRHLNHLNSGVVANLDRSIRWQRHKWKAKLARERVLAGAGALEDGVHHIRHVWWVAAESHVDVEEGCRMASVPPWYHGYCTAIYGPFCSVGCYGFTSTWIEPLLVIVERICSPSRVCDLEMSERGAE